MKDIIERIEGLTEGDRAGKTVSWSPRGDSSVKVRYTPGEENGKPAAFDVTVFVWGKKVVKPAECVMKQVMDGLSKERGIQNFYFVKR